MPTKTAPKKAVKKTAPKKAAPKAKKITPKKGVIKTKSAKTAKAVKKSNNFKALVCAIDGECFWTRDGAILKNLEDLYLAFGSMDDEIFLHHVTKQKNDFADWTEVVLQDADCATDLRKSKKKTQAQKAVLKHLKQYSV